MYVGDRAWGSRATPSRREDREGHTTRNTILVRIGVGWLVKKYKERKKRQEQKRLNVIRAREFEDELRFEALRRRSRHRPEDTDSYMSSELTASTVEPPRPGSVMPPLAASATPVAAIAQSQSLHDDIEPVPAPLVEPQQWQESGSEVYNSAGGPEHWRHHERGGEAEAAVCTEEESRRREQSHGQSVGPQSQPVSVNVQVHGNRGVTLRRLTEEEAAADRRARRTPKDSSYYSEPRLPPPESLASHGTSSGASLNAAGAIGGEDPAERRRRRRLERSRGQAAGALD